VRREVGLAVAAAVLLAGCSAKTPKSHFYSLTPLAEEGAVAGQTAGDRFSLGIEPVALPDHLVRPQMVIRRDNRLELLEFQRWGGSLEEGFSRVLAENLSRLLGSARVATYPWAGNFSPDYRLAIDLVQFDGSPEAGVSLVCRWSVTDTRKKEVLLVERTAIAESISGEGFSSFAASHSLALMQLSRQIADSLAALPGAGNR